MAKYFKYNVRKLINYVKDRPCLWDKSLESYKDRTERRLAWEEVFSLLQPLYPEKSHREKKITEEHIMSKWTNIRDAFIKTLKNKHKKPKRRYVFHKELEFLIPHITDQTLLSEEADYISAEYTNEFTLYNPMPIKDEKDTEKDPIPVIYNTRKRSKKQDSCDNDDNFNFVEVDSNDPLIMNEDEAFFASLLPSVVTYTEDERLEFRIEVLALMKRIKVNRYWTIGNLKQKH